MHKIWWRYLCIGLALLLMVMHKVNEGGEGRRWCLPRLALLLMMMNEKNDGVSGTHVAGNKKHDATHSPTYVQSLLIPIDIAPFLIGEY